MLGVTFGEVVVFEFVITDKWLVGYKFIFVVVRDGFVIRRGEGILEGIIDSFFESR